MWTSRTKQDLVIEIWEKLDCESVGAAEIEAIEEAVNARYGASAVESPMRIARILADEGAALRHAEIMQLWIDRFTSLPHEAEFRNLLKVSTLSETLGSIRRIENLRRKFASVGDKEGMRLIRDDVIAAKKEAQRRANDRYLAAKDRKMNAEISEWLTIWLQSPEVFENWIKLRRNSADYKNKFGTGRKS